MFKTNRILDRLNTMLDNAISGKNVESDFDESKVSQIESKLHKFLLAVKKQKEQITEHKLNIDGLISDISHQTKTPIANILLYSELVSECDNDADRKKHTDLLINQAEKLNFLIASLMKTSRLENGLIAVNPKHQGVDVLLNSISDIYSNTEIISSDVEAVFDLKWTCEAVFNIIDNALKYGADKVFVSVMSYELFVKIDIADNGMGIAEEEIPKIFTRFYRSQAVQEQDGVGIGLYLAREIISKQGGYISVKSKPGVGSTFSVFLQKE